MIDKREQFVFWIRESQTNKTPTSTTNIHGFFGKEVTEEHDSQKEFIDCRVNLFFASLDLAINE